MNRPVHFEILGHDPEALIAFYRDAFGWKAQTWEGPQGYWVVTTGPEGTPGIDGGFMHRHFEQAVINTIGVESLATALEKIEAGGGSLVDGPNEIPEVGRHAYCADPEGNLFGILEPMPREAEPAGP